MGLNPRILLDTHAAVHWLLSPKQLSKEQLRILREVVRQRQTVGVSAITLLEIAALFGSGSRRGHVPAAYILREIDVHDAIQVVPLSVEIATEIAAMGGALPDPADRAIVATAKVHRLRLITSDQRIIESNLVPVVS